MNVSTKKEKARKIKEKLIERKNKLISQLKKFAKRNKEIKGDYKSEFPKIGDHKDENALEVSDYENTLSIEHDLERELKGVSDALKKTSEGTYGICSRCGKPINPKRLDIMPEATLCVECGESGK